MIRIAVCDGNREDLSKVLSYITEFTRLPDGAYLSLHPFRLPSELLAAAEKKGPFDIYLLDVLMPETDGISLGKQLRKFDPDGVIIYLTSSEDYALDAFNVYAFQYLLKPAERSVLFPVIQRAIARVQRTHSEMIAVKTKNGMVSLPVGSILYAEMLNHSVYFHLCGRESVQSTYLRGSFEESIRPLLVDERFIRPHKSFVVNLCRVAAMRQHDFEMENGARIPVARSSVAAVKCRYLEFILHTGENNASCPGPEPAAMHP